MAETNASKAAKSAAQPIKDVTPPGESAPSPNSKSVIINNRPMLKDPMVASKPAAAKGGASDDSPSGAPTKSGDKLTAPLMETEEPDKVTVSTKAAKPPTPSKEAEVPVEPEPDTDDKPDKPDKEEKPAKSEAKETPPAEDKQPDEPAEEDKTPAEDKKPDEPAEGEPAEDEPEKPAEPSEHAESDEPAKDEPAEPTEDDKQDDKPDKEGKPAEQTKAEAEAAKEAQRQEAIEKLADSKKYYLSINSVEKRKAKHFVVLGLVLALLLAVAWADVALDAGLIHVNGIKPPTHFFSN